MTDVQLTLAAYVSDMLALEEHVCIPFKNQRDDADFQSMPQAAALVGRIAALADTHIETLRSALDSLGGHPPHAAKSAFTNIEGWIASAIDKMRKTKVAKGLRDDYTAIALCTAGYNMLLTTANALGNDGVAQLARRHLQDYAQAIVDIGDALPAVVLEDLTASGVQVESAVTARSQAEIRTAWRAGESPTTTTGTIDSEASLNRTGGGTYPTI